MDRSERSPGALADAALRDFVRCEDLVVASIARGVADLEAGRTRTTDEVPLDECDPDDESSHRFTNQRRSASVCLVIRAVCVDSAFRILRASYQSRIDLPSADRWWIIG